MLVIELILSVFGIGLLRWLIFTLVVYALPFFVGLTAGMAAFHRGAGDLGALLIGIVVGAVTLGVGQVAFALVKPIPLRAAISAVFAFRPRSRVTTPSSGFPKSVSRRCSGGSASPGSAPSSSAAQPGRA